MLKYKKIRVKDKYIEALSMPLANKNLIVLRGSKGYVMCGYLNACTYPAKRLGIYKGQPIKDVLRIIL